jgi:hypothetical protein
MPFANSAGRMWTRCAIARVGHRVAQPTAPGVDSGHSLPAWGSGDAKETPAMDIDPKDTALVITDPQNDFLSPTG